MDMTHKPYTTVLQQLISSIEADARSSAQDKAELFNRLEGLIAVPALVWRSKASQANGNTQQRRPIE
jgi:hypothetical protein